jgi:hypothetical protein
MNIGNSRGVVNAGVECEDMRTNGSAGRIRTHQMVKVSRALVVNGSKIAGEYKRYERYVECHRPKLCHGVVLYVVNAEIVGLRSMCDEMVKLSVAFVVEGEHAVLISSEVIVWKALRPVDIRTR